MKFTHLPLPQPKYNWVRSERNGKRVYVAEGTDYVFPSITTVLGSLENKGLQEWRRRVGEENANRISRKAATQGTILHSLCEEYIKNGVKFDPSDEAPYSFPWIEARFERFKPLLDRIDNVYLQEKSMASVKLGVSGTPDCIAEFDGVLSVIDFKTSTKPKKEEYIKNYFMQETAYAIMFFETYDLRATQLVTLISCETGEDQVFIQKPRDHYPDLVNAIGVYNLRAGKQ